MKFMVTVNDQLWQTLTKDTSFSSPEEAMQHFLVRAFYGSGTDKIGSQLILVTGKVKVELITEDKH